MERVHWLKPKKPREIKPMPFMFTDIETYGVKAKRDHGKFALARIAYEYMGIMFEAVFRNLTEYLDYLIDPSSDHPALIFAWNIKFDAKFILGELNKRGWVHTTVTIERKVRSTQKDGTKINKVITEEVPTVKCIDNNHGKWLCLEIRNPDNPKKTIKIQEAMNWFPYSLEAAIDKFNIPHEKIPVPFNDVTPDNLELLAIVDKHCRNDVLAGYELVKYFIETCQDSLKIRPQLTLAATAMEFFKCHCLDWTIPMISKYFAQFVRQGYYGGKTEVYSQLHEEDCYIYDVNSLYPFMYYNKLPVGRPYLSLVRPDEVVKLERLGFIDCTVEIPAQPLPPLPWRNQQSQLIFPWGRVRGIWFTEELKNAISNHDVKVLTVHETVLWKYNIDILAKFAAITEGLKRDAKSPGEYQIFKQIRNSLYGKFGERRERRDIHFEPIPQDRRLDTNIEIHEGETDENDIPYWVEVTEGRRRGHQLVQIAASITAYARVDMAKRKREIAGQGIKIMYTDTDSVITDKPIPDSMIGKNDGQFKLEDSGDLLIALAPKVYYFRGKDSERVKIKGFPPNNNTEKHFRDALAGYHNALSVTWLHPNFNYESISYELREVSRTLQYLDRKRVHPDYYTSSPIYVNTGEV